LTAFVVELDGSLPEREPEVFSKAMIISDDFSRSLRQQKTERSPAKVIDGLLASDSVKPC
jgi:hypothetical protein